MGPFMRRLLGAGHFPRMKGQDMPEPVAKGKPEAVAPDTRSRALRPIEASRGDKPKPPKE